MHTERHSQHTEDRRERAEDGRQHTEKQRDLDGLNRPTGGLLVIDVSEYQPCRTTGRTAIEIFLNRRPEGNVIAFLRDPIVAHLTHTYPA